VITIEKRHPTLRASFVAEASVLGALAAALAMSAVAEAHLLAAGPTALPAGVVRTKPPRLDMGAPTSIVRWWYGDTLAVVQAGAVRTVTGWNGPVGLVPDGIDGARVIETANGRLAVGDAHGQIVVFEQATTTPSRFFSVGAATRELALSSDGALLAALNSEGIVRVFSTGAPRTEEEATPDVEQKHELSVWPLDPSAHIAFGATGYELVTATPDGNVEVRTIEGNVLRLRRLGQAGGPALALTASEGTAVTVGAFPNTTQIWDLLSSQESWKFLTGPRAVRPVAAVRFRGAKKELVSLCDDDTIRVWDASSGAEIQCLREADATASWNHPRFVSGSCSIDVAPDGRRAVVATGGSALEIWDLETGRELTAH
jgi:hypothetical protein